MATQATFDIHADEEEQYQSATEDNAYMNGTGSTSAASGEASDVSDDSDGAVEDLVAEDIEKFTDTFKGISTRFRLINRIGEGERVSEAGVRH